MIDLDYDIKFQNVQDPPRASPAQGGKEEAPRPHSQVIYIKTFLDEYLIFILNFSFLVLYLG